jgi:hypothetical protein
MGLWPNFGRFDWHSCRQREVEYKDAADWPVLVQGRIRVPRLRAKGPYVFLAQPAGLGCRSRSVIPALSVEC